MVCNRLLIPLFSPATGTFGGLTRAVAVARAAEQSGIQVAFCASGEMAAYLHQAGFQVYSMPASTLFHLPGPLSRLLAKRSQKSTIPVRPGKPFGNIWFVQVFSGAANSHYLKKLVQAELDAIKEFRPNRIFTDLDLAAYLAASIKRIPIAGAFQGVLQQGRGSFFWKIVNASVRYVTGKFTIAEASPDELMFGRKVLKIIPSIPELEGVNPRRPDVCYVGQLLGEFQRDAEIEIKPDNQKKCIYVYVGTGALPLDQVRTILPGVLESLKGWSAIVGGADIRSPERVGPVQFYRYVPAASILPECSWTLCHGGQNTIIQSLLYGVPLLVFPGPIFERRYNAHKVQGCRAGLMGELPDFHPEWLLARLEQWQDFAPNAFQLGEKIKSYGGAQQAVDAIAAWNPVNHRV